MNQFCHFSGSDISSESSLRTIQQQQSTFLNGSLILTSQEDIGVIDSGDSISSAKKILITSSTSDSEKLNGPDIISHTNALKHRRKIIAIPVDGNGSGSLSPQGRVV